VRRAPSIGPWVAACVLLASCDPRVGLHLPGREARSLTWIVARDVAAGRAGAATAPALVARDAGTAGETAVLPVSHTRISAMLVGPIATIERAKQYAGSARALEVSISFTPPAMPARQDYAVHAGGRALTILIRERLEAQELARTLPDASLIGDDPQGRVVVPVGVVHGAHDRPRRRDDRPGAVARRRVRAHDPARPRRATSRSPPTCTVRVRSSS